jgi:hypothetical protein
VTKTSSAKKRPPAAKRDEIELVPDAWPRFEQFIKQVAKAGPKHRERPAPKPHTSPATKKHEKRES